MANKKLTELTIANSTLADTDIIYTVVDPASSPISGKTTIGELKTNLGTHDAVTVTDSSEIDFTLTGQDITASIINGSIDETKLDVSVNASLDLADSSLQSGDNISELTNDSGFITGNETITISGDASGSGVTSIDLMVDRVTGNVRNETGGTLTVGTAVYISGFNNLPLVSKADNAVNGKEVLIGIVEANISNNSNGVIVIIGQMDLDTDALGNVGDEIYLSTAGTLTTTKPTSGDIIIIGKILVKDNAGSIMVHKESHSEDIAVTSGNDIVARMGDSAGSNKFVFKDYSNTEVAAIDSDGNITLSGTVDGVDLASKASSWDAKMSDVVDDTTPTLGGTLDADGNVIVNVQKLTFESVVNNGTKTTNFSVDFDAGQKQVVTLSANTMTITLDTTSVGVGNYVLIINNGGLATITWAGEASSVVWPGGTAPTLTASGVDVVSFFFDGSTWYGVASLAFA